MIGHQKADEKPSPIELGAIVEYSDDAILGKTLDGVITSWNPAAERIYGYSSQEIIGKSIEVLIPASRGDEMLTILARIRAGTRVDHFETIRRRKDGTEFSASISVSPIRNAAGTIVGASSIARDVSEARQASQYARSLIEAALDPLVTISAEGKITDVNEATVKVTGVPREGLVGTDFSGYFTNPDQANEGYQQVFAQGQVTDYPLTLRHRDGRLTEVLYNASVYRDPRGRVLGVLAAARDMTDRRRDEQMLREKNVELEHASRMKSEFLATMSHELRTPMNSVIGFSEALKDGLLGELSDSQKEYIGEIFTSGQHLLSLINDILDLSKIEAGMMHAELEAVNVNDLLTHTLSVVREKAAAGSIGLDLDLDEHLGVTNIDLRKTKQIVYNLLSNAVKFSSQGGRVSLSARHVPRSAVGTLEGSWPVRSFELANNEFTEFLQICVTDSGMGISVENMAKLFQAFTQIESTLARRFEGTGLGLAMVKQMTELLGGTVAMASQEGQGSCFAAWVPLRACENPEFSEVRVEKAPAVHGSGGVALVVEDDDNAAELARILLEAEGFDVLRAASAEEALQIAPQQNLDLITVDIQLPGIDGWQFLSSIGADPNLSSVPVVVVSGASNSLPVALARGAAAVLQKPVSHAALKEALSNLGFYDDPDQTRTVLVVDDDPMAVEMIATFLPVPAYATVRAYGGAEAIVLARRVRPDLILLDLMMPEVSGFDVVHALKSEPSTADIPILVVTAKQITTHDREVLGADPGQTIHIIEKAGFNRGDFLAEVRRALPRR